MIQSLAKVSRELLCDNRCNAAATHFSCVQERDYERKFVCRRCATKMGVKVEE